MLISIVSNRCQSDQAFTNNVLELRQGLEKQGFIVTSFFSTQLLGDLPDLAKVIIFLDKDQILGRRLEQEGYILINSITAIANADDKAVTDLILRRHNIDQLETYPGPLIYPGYDFDDFSFLDDLIPRLGLPLVLKECHGSFGHQVHLLSSRQEIINKILSLNGRRFLIQKMASASGVDYRLQVIGDRVVAAVKRVAPEGAFVTNLTSGGVGLAHQPTSQEISLALAASAALGLEFAGVDLIYHQGRPKVLEVNSNARIARISAIAQVDIASAFAKYLKNRYFQS